MILCIITIIITIIITMIITMIIITSTAVALTPALALQYQEVANRTVKSPVMQFVPISISAFLFQL